MVRTSLAILTIIVIILFAAPAGAQIGASYTFCWAPSPTVDADGAPLAPVDHYEVWMKRGTEPARLLATVADDTTCTVSPLAPGEYRIRICAVDAHERPSEPSPWSDPLLVARRHPAGGTRPHLQEAFPNPCNPSTTLRYQIPDGLAAGVPIRMQVYDARGRLVRRLPVDTSPGWHDVRWLGRNDRGESVASGLYLVHFTCGAAREIRRVTLVK